MFNLLFALTLLVHSHQIQSTEQVEALVDLNLLQALKLPVIAKSEKIGVGYAVLTPQMQNAVLQMNHARGRCAGFEVIPPSPRGIESHLQSLKDLEFKVERDRRWRSFSPRGFTIPERPEITKALSELSEQNLRDFVAWASSFPSRNHQLPDPNVHVRALVEKLKPLAQLARLKQVPFQIELVNHQRIKQKTVLVRIPGRVAPNEVVVLGAHFDSISYGGSAPGADDNASGSGNLFDVLRVLLAQGVQPARTIEFYWYAGEEGGLLGSAEIAQANKSAKRQVISVLQLDMTLFPGSGEFTIASMTDFTSSWLRDFLVAMNQTYLKIRIVEDECGYGCSDHASWYRAGYPTLMPFEAQMSRSNRKIHTTSDVVTNQSSFRHSLVFSKIALVFAIELGNNLQARQPYL